MGAKVSVPPPTCRVPDDVAADMRARLDCPLVWWGDLEYERLRRRAVEHGDDRPHCIARPATPEQRRQLLALLHARVWQWDEAVELPLAARNAFLSSYMHQQRLSRTVEGPFPHGFSRADLDAEIDLRPFTDAAPFMVGELMPLARVYQQRPRTLTSCERLS